MVFKEGATLFDNVVDPKPLVLFQYYMWNMTNPDEFESGQKPKFVQRGPYTYREKYRKINITQENGAFENSSYLGYVQERHFYFDRERSCSNCEMDDPFVNINIVATAVHGIIRNFLRLRPELASRNVSVACDRDDVCRIVLSCILCESALTANLCPGYYISVHSAKFSAENGKWKTECRGKRKALPIPD